MLRRAGAAAHNLPSPKPLQPKAPRVTRALLTLLIVAAALACACSTPPNAGPDAPKGGTATPAPAPDGGDPTDGALPADPDATTSPSASAPKGEALKSLIATARAAVTEAFDAADPRRDPVKLRALLASLADAPDTTPAAIQALLPSWSPDAANLSDQALLIRLCLLAHDFPRAQTLAWAAATAADAAAAANPDDPSHKSLRDDFIKLWYASFSQDPAFIPPSLLTLEENTHLTKMTVMSREGTSILFKIKNGDTTVGVLKAMQRLWLSNYRGEIASYRLCPLIHCGFSVPHNQEARIDKPTFSRVNIEDKDWMDNRKGKGIVLVWFKDDGKEYLYGTYKAWAPGFTQFPIEDSELWEKALKVDGTPLADLEAQSFPDFMKPFAKKHEKKYKAVLERADTVTTMDFLRQLSNLHVYDALTNNWDRYTSQPYPGLNCQFNHGQFVSIDNGATFQNKEDQASHADFYANAGRRLRTRIGRFSRSTINSLRWMDDATMRAILFPPSPHHTDEDERFQLFLERRDAVLKHVDKLIKEHGEDKVLVFP
jgi:hypothetical protein